MEDNEKVRKDFQEYLKTKRTEKKLSIRKLSELTGVSHTYLSQVETDKRGIPSPEILKKLHGPLGVSYDKLMEKAGHISPTIRSELIPETIQALESGMWDEIFNSAANYFVDSMTDSNGKLLKEWKEYVFMNAIHYYPNYSSEEIDEVVSKPNFLRMLFENLTVEEKIRFVDFILKDNLNKEKSENQVNETHSEYVAKHSILNVPILGYIAAGNPVFAEEHIEEWTEIPNMWNLKEDNVFILKVKGDSMIGSRIYEGDKVVVKIQPEVESGEIAVVNVNGDEATLKRVKKTENGQVILYPDNPKYEPIFITNENARIVGKVIQVIFEP